MMTLDIDVMLDKGAKMPSKRYIDDAGYILCTKEGFTVETWSREVIHTGVHMDIPEGYCEILKALPEQNAKGIILDGVGDARNTDEIIAYVYNKGMQRIHFDAGKPVARIIITPVPYIYLHETKEFSKYR